MKVYKLVIAYDGTDYFGWQTLPEKPSIAAALNKTFVKVFKSEIKILGASRTDAGVHALGQVARIKTDLDITPDKLKWAWNNGLPTDIAIRSLKLVDDSFNPFCNVKSKIYYYHFFTERPLPFIQRYGYFYPYKIDFDIFNCALQFFVGTHDFCAFKSSEDMRKNTIRTIDAITLNYLPRYKAYRITIKGQKFLRHMIRRIVGASLAVASSSASSFAKSFGEHGKALEDRSKNGHTLESLQKIMTSCDPRHTLPNAPAQGLMLYKIIYDEKSSPSFDTPLTGHSGRAAENSQNEQKENNLYPHTARPEYFT